jgi:hypothetical protein
LRIDVEHRLGWRSSSAGLRSHTQQPWQAPQVHRQCQNVEGHIDLGASAQIDLRDGRAALLGVSEQRLDLAHALTNVARVMGDSRIDRAEPGDMTALGGVLPAVLRDLCGDPRR